MAAKGISFGYKSLEQFTKPGGSVTVNWKVTSNLPGKRWVVTVSDVNGMEVEQYEINLLGQVEPFTGSWTFIVPPGTEKGYWLVRGEFWPDHPAFQDHYEGAGECRFGVDAGEFKGSAINSVRVVKRYV